MNRRSFLATSLAGAAGLGFPTRASWATPAGPAESFRLTYFTDIHARTEWDVPEALALAAKKINETEGDLVICGGDCITDGFQSGQEAVRPRWKAYQEGLAKQLKPPARTAIGNHDLVGAIPEDGSQPEKDPRAMFRTEMGVQTTYASFPAGAYHVVMLDPFRITNDEWKYHGFVDEVQMKWLGGGTGKDQAGGADYFGVPHAVGDVFFSGDGRAGEGRAAQPGGHEQSGSVGSVCEAPAAPGLAGSPACERDPAVAGYDLHHGRGDLRQVVAGGVARDTGGIRSGDDEEG